MKTKIVSMISVGFLLTTSLFSFASAEEDGTLRVVTGTKVEIKRNATSSDERTDTNRRSTSTEFENDDNDDDYDYDDNNSNDNNGTTSIGKDDDGEINASFHLSSVASFVQSLNKIAEREGGIGDRVRVIARAQNDSLASTTEAMVKVEERGSFRKFLFGPDYKNLGIIRSELASTTNNIAQLTSLLSQTMSNTSRVELTAQIQALKNEQLKMNAYITAHEEMFSLFGWFNKPAK